MVEHQEMHGLTLAVRGVHGEVHRIAWGMVRTELQWKLVSLEDDQSSSSENSESAGSWRTRLEDMVEWSSKEWRTLVESEVL